MSVVRTFPIARIPLVQLFRVSNTVGAHIASKLDMFSSSETTLTDELCDMYFLWARSVSQKDGEFELTISKTTQIEEAASGNDLYVTLITPAGAKRVLLQAKVWDPLEDTIRNGWTKLKRQLRKMSRNHRDAESSGLLLYVPARLLYSNKTVKVPFPTWELGERADDDDMADTLRFGTTVFPEGTLLGPKGWKQNPPVKITPGVTLVEPEAPTQSTTDDDFDPLSFYGPDPVGRPIIYPEESFLSFSEFLFAMFACEIGMWQDPDDVPPLGSPHGPMMHGAKELRLRYTRDDWRDINWENIRRRLCHHNPE